MRHLIYRVAYLAAGRPDSFRARMLKPNSIVDADQNGTSSFRSSSKAGRLLPPLKPPPAEALWLAIRIERRLGNQQAEAAFTSQLRSRYPTSPEYQEFLKGNFQ